MTAPRLRILVVHNRYRSSQPSGEDRVVDQEINLLEAAGHDVRIFERRSDDIASMPLHAKLAIPFQVPWNAHARDELARYLVDHRPDIVHVHNTFPLLSPSVLEACRAARIPVVATLHNYLQICPSGLLFREGRVCVDCVGGLPLASVRHGCYRGSRLATAPRTANMMINRRRWWSDVARFFCVSKAQRQTLVQAGMPADQLSVKYNFISDTSARRDGIGEHVLFLGRLDEQKGLPTLMAAWDRIAEGRKAAVPLILAGAGPLEERVTQWAQGRDDVRYLGLQTRNECEVLTARARAIVAPSASMEPLSGVLIEAAAAGVPAVAPAHGGAPEAVLDGVTGVLHRPNDVASLADGLHRMISDVDDNRRMGEAARLHYEQTFTPAASLCTLVAGYQAVIGARGEAVPVPR